ncbi:bifunctional DNA primase/polymerase [Kribbella endophytica]
MNTSPNTTRGRSRAATPDRLARAAHWHAARGLAVFPLSPGSKIPAVEDWPHVATTDRDQITLWWREAAYNVGVATGPSGLLAVDLDQPRTPDQVAPATARGATCGRDVLDQLAEAAGQRLPRTWSVTTPSGGQHLYFRRPDGTELGNTAGRLGWKIDTRGVGGYVVGAGSMIQGQRYRADVIRRPALLPDWIAVNLTPPPPPAESPSAPHNADAYALAALSGELDNLLDATEGHRNHALNRAAFLLGQLVAGGALDQATVHDELLSAAERIRLSRAEAERTIRSGLRGGAQHPRSRKTA